MAPLRLGRNGGRGKIGGNSHDMGESAEIDKMTTLESRLAAALDRIAAGIAQRPAGGQMLAPAPDVAVPDGDSDALMAAQSARAEAEARARDLTDRVAALEARLAEAQDALGAAEAGGGDTSEADNSADEAALAALKAERDAAIAKATDLEEALADLRVDAEAEKAHRVREIADLRMALAAAQTAAQAAAKDAAPSADAPVDADADARIEKLEADATVMRNRIIRLRAERADLRAQRDAAQDTADELAEAAGAEPEARVISMRGELRRLALLVDAQAVDLDQLKQGPDGSVLARVAERQLIAMKELRRSEAAELARILAEIEGDAATDVDADAEEEGNDG